MISYASSFVKKIMSLIVISCCMPVPYVKSLREEIPLLAAGSLFIAANGIGHPLIHGNASESDTTLPRIGRAAASVALVGGSYALSRYVYQSLYKKTPTYKVSLMQKIIDDAKKKEIATEELTTAYTLACVVADEIRGNSSYRILYRKLLNLDHTAASYCGNCFSDQYQAFNRNDEIKVLMSDEAIKLSDQEFLGFIQRLYQSKEEYQKLLQIVKSGENSLKAMSSFIKQGRLFISLLASEQSELAKVTTLSHAFDLYNADYQNLFSRFSTRALLIRRFFSFMDAQDVYASICAHSLFSSFYL
jgi:hypothetical protein